MGQQQLLLIVLGIIIVGAAIIVSISVFTANAEESAKDAILSDSITLGAIAQQYFRRPKPLGGGSTSFEDWSIPPGLDTTDNGIYIISQPGDAADVEITGSPLPSTGYSWNIVTTVTHSNVTSIVSGS